MQWLALLVKLFFFQADVDVKVDDSISAAVEEINKDDEANLLNHDSFNTPTTLGKISLV